MDAKRTGGERDSRVSDGAVVFMDILGFRKAVDRGPEAIIPIYDLVSHSFYPHNQLNSERKINHFFAISDSIMAVAPDVEAVFGLALQVFTSFFDNLDYLAENPNALPVLVRGAIAYDWMATPYGVEANIDEPTTNDRPLNIVGKALTEAYGLSEGLKADNFGACLRMSERAFARISGIESVRIDKTNEDPAYHEVRWPMEVFQEWPDAAGRYLRNVRLGMKRLEGDLRPDGVAKTNRPRGLRHWDATLLLLQECASKLGLADSGGY